MRPGDETRRQAGAEGFGRGPGEKQQIDSGLGISAAEAKSGWTSPAQRHRPPESGDAVAHDKLVAAAVVVVAGRQWPGRCSKNQAGAMPCNRRVGSQKRRYSLGAAMKNVLSK